MSPIVPVHLSREAVYINRMHCIVLIFMYWKVFANEVMATFWLIQVSANTVGG